MINRRIKLSGAGTSLVDRGDIEMEVHSSGDGNQSKLQLITEEDLHSRGIHKKQESLRSPSQSQTYSASNSPNTQELNKLKYKIESNDNHDDDGEDDDMYDTILEEEVKEEVIDIESQLHYHNSRSTQRTNTHTSTTAPKYYIKHPMLTHDTDITATVTTATQSNTHLNVLLSGMKTNVDYSLPRSRPPSFIDHPQEMSQSQTWSTTLLDVVHPTSQSIKSVTPPPIIGTVDDDLDLMTNAGGSNQNVGSSVSVVGRNSSSYETPTPV